MSTADDLKNRAAFFRNPDYVKHGFPGHLIEPLAAELESAADELIGYENDNDTLDQEVDQLTAEIQQKDQIIQAMFDALPENWCDPLLSGDGGLPIPAKCPDVERFIQALRQRMIEASTVSDIQNTDGGAVATGETRSASESVVGDGKPSTVTPVATRRGSDD